MKMYAVRVEKMNTFTYFYHNKTASYTILLLFSNKIFLLKIKCKLNLNKLKKKLLKCSQFPKYLTVLS